EDAVDLILEKSLDGSGNADVARIGEDRMIEGELEVTEADLSRLAGHRVVGADEHVKGAGRVAGLHPHAAVAEDSRGLPGEGDLAECVDAGGAELGERAAHGAGCRVAGLDDGAVG